MFDQLVAAHGSAPRRRARTIVITTSVVVHASALAILAIVAMWRIDKLELGYHGNRVNALSIPHNSGGGARPKAELVARKEEPKVIKVIPKVIIQPEKHVAKEAPKTDAEMEGATGAGDAPLGDGGGGDGKGLGKPTSDQPCTGEKCLGGGGGDGGGTKKLTCKQGETLIDGKCTKKKEIAVLSPDVAAGLRKSGNEQIPAPQSVRVSMMHENKSRVVGTIKLCLDTRGHVDRVQVLKSTGYDAYDDVLVDEIRDWRYAPYTVEGDPVPACTVVTIVYVMK